MAIVASGQLTITDLNDAKQLVMYIGASQSKMVIFNGVSTYVPLYSSANQVLTPQLFVAGSSADVSSSVTSTKWFYQINSTGAPVEITASTTDYLLTGTTFKTLTLRTNLLTTNTNITYISEMVYPDANTGFDITIKADISINKITNGTNGTNGANAIMAILTNESDVIPTDSAGNNGNFTGANTTMSIYEGASDVSASWAVTAVASGLTGSLTTRTYTVTAMSTDTAYVDLTATRSGYATIVKRFALSKSKTGVAGTSPTLYRMLSSADVLQRNIAGAYTPTTLTFSAKSQTGTGAYGNYSGRYMIWESLDGTTWGTVKYSGIADEASKVWTPTAGIKAVKGQLFLAGGVTTMLDEQIVSVVSDGLTGASAIMAVLSNESHNLPADVNGTVSTYANASSTMTIYEGATDVSASWTFAQVRVGTGLVVTEATTSRTATVTGIGAVDTASVTWTATRSGYASIVKTFNVAKSKGGGNASAYWMLAPSAVVKNSLGVYSPATIVASGKSQVGIASPVNYNARYVFSDSPDGVTFTVRYTTPADIASYAYTPLPNIKAVKVQQYLAGGVTNLIDEQIIPIVFDGVDSVYAYVWNPDGNIVRNSTGSVTCHIDIYKGSSTVTGSAFKWYSQDPSATTVSGGDVDGGNGWRLLNVTYNAGTTGYTTETLTIPASAITGTQSFKCVATYNSIKYTGVTVVVDVSDPISVRLDGLNMFKNGTGLITVKAIIIQSGLELDALGSGGYTYTWNIYDASNVVTAFTKTGKEITVNATDISVRGNLVCTVTK